MGPNQQVGSATGAVMGGLPGNTIGKGASRVVSTDEIANRYSRYP